MVTPEKDSMDNDKDRQKEQQENFKKRLSLMELREKSLGHKSYCNNPESYRLRKIIRSNIKDIYFFGQEITEEEIDSFEWK